MPLGDYEILAGRIEECFKTTERRRNEDFKILNDRRNEAFDLLASRISSVSKGVQVLMILNGVLILALVTLVLLSM